MRLKIALACIPVYIVVMVLVFRYHEPSSGPLPVPEASELGPEQTPPPTVIFRDITQASGVNFLHDTGNYGEILFPEINGPGCGFIDFDNDGDQDLFLVNSGKWPHKVTDTSVPTVTHSLYRNDGNGTFTDVGAEMGLQARSYALGVCFGDFDNDGFEDLYLTCAGPNVLFRNEEGRRFVDVTREAGVECPEWSSVAAFLDYDRDGQLDILIGNYVKWSVEIERKALADAAKLLAETESRTGRLALESEEDRQRVERLRKEGSLSTTDEFSYAPNLYEATHCTLYRNLGESKFEDVSEEAGLFRKERGGKPYARCMGLAVGDYDEDGWPDVAVANDDGPDFLFRNLGSGKFRDIAFEVGLATGDNGQFQDSMGVQWVDYRNDGNLCLSVGHYSGQRASLYVPRGDAKQVFLNVGMAEGLGELPLASTAWGQFYFDYDLDGRQDFFIACGHVSPGRALYANRPYKQRQGLFWNTGQTPTFRLIGPEHVGPDLCREVVGRGTAHGDIDGDGDLDILLVTNAGPAYLFRNEASAGRRFVRLKLIGRKSNRSAIGARVRLRTGKTWQRRDVTSGGNYGSQSEMPVTFGLGPAERPDEVVVWWPSGTEQALTDVPLNTTVPVTEGLDGH